MLESYLLTIFSSIPWSLLKSVSPEFEKYFCFNYLSWIYTFSKTFWCSLIFKLTLIYLSICNLFLVFIKKLLWYLSYLVFICYSCNCWTSSGATFNNFECFFLNKIENETDVFVYPWLCCEKSTLDQSFLSKHQIFSFENCCWSKEEGRKSWWHLENLVAGREGGSGTWEEKTHSVTDLKSKHLVKWLLL